MGVDVAVGNGDGVAVGGGDGVAVGVVEPTGVGLGDADGETAAPAVPVAVAAMVACDAPPGSSVERTGGRDSAWTKVLVGAGGRNEIAVGGMVADEVGVGVALGR
jgi:hypothetical protein